MQRCNSVTLSVTQSVLVTDCLSVSATLLMNHQGQMRRAAAEAYFKIIRGGLATTKRMSRALSYIPEYGDNWRCVHPVKVHLDKVLKFASAAARP